MLPSIRQVVLSSPWNPSRLFKPTDTGDWWVASDNSRIWTSSAATTLAGDGVGVGRWDGRRGIGSITQGTSSKKPTRRLVNGLWYVSFDGTDDFLQGSFTIAQPMTRISALQQPTWTINRKIFDGTSANNVAILFQVSASPELDVSVTGGASIADTTHATVGVNHVVVEVYNGSSSSIQIDNFSSITGTLESASIAGLTVGARADGAQVGNALIYSTIVIGRVLNSTELLLAKKWCAGTAGIRI